MPKRSDIKKVLVIGSGPIVIGQAAEFDYAGAQACRVLKDAGVNVVLCNSNPATIMTDSALADEIYLEPLTLESIKRIIVKERPDSLLASLGGQTGLTIGCQLAKEGFLDEYGVKLIGPARASLYACVEPIAATLLSAFWLHEPFALIDLLGFAMIIATILILGYSDLKAQ